MPAESEKQTLSPTSMSLADAARVLSKTYGETITVAMLQGDVDDGAPTNADGTINLVHLAAWLAKELSTRAN